MHRTRHAWPLWLSPHTMVIPGWVNIPAPVRLRGRCPVGLFIPYRRNPNSLAFVSICLICAAAMASAMGSAGSCVGMEWSIAAIVLSGGALQPTFAQAGKSLWRGDFMHQVQVDNITSPENPAAGPLRGKPRSSQKVFAAWKAPMRSTLKLRRLLQYQRLPMAWLQRGVRLYPTGRNGLWLWEVDRAIPVKRFPSHQMADWF